MTRDDIIRMARQVRDGGHTTDPIVEAVRQKLHDRSQVGLKKYGTGLDRTDLTRLDWLRHAQEEAQATTNSGGHATP